MTHRAPATLALAALLLAACGDKPPGPVAGEPASPAVAAARDAIEAANRATAEAVARGDAAAVVSHYADDAIVLPAGGDAVTGPRDIQGYFQRAMDAGMKGLSLQVQSVEAGGDLAVETGTYEASDADGRRLDYGKYVVTWRRADGQWKAYRDISTTSRPVTPPAADAGCVADAPAAPGGSG